MRDATIARNYAETLLVLAGRAEDLRGWGKMLTDVATAMDENPTLRLFLESPKVSAEQKSAVLGKAFTDRMPRLMLRFIQSLVMHRRQMLIPEIAEEYLNLVDAAEGRMHARVTVARETDDAGRAAIAQQLSRVFGKEVVPHVSVDPSILGGVIVHVGDTVLDGSVRKRLASLRRRMLTGR
ncbi:MAG TPA: F0F1 ATP synthase subunit delta [Gemmatimonadaceae bacterium]|jgi:F-type H+-transporting ATPase subunit delta|nr:F0F1 ATP synthase subunit delta [Gemmatimonadaceae bacterium]